MTNLFLKVNKDLFKLGLNPTEILLLAQIMEYNTTTGDFFMSDAALADNFGVSSKTISRSLKALEESGYICRNTRNTKGGKVRHITVNSIKIEETLKKNEEEQTTDKMTVENHIEETQESKSPLTKDKMTLDKGQNDSIKDKEKDNILKEKNQGVDLEPNGSKSTPIVGDGSLGNPIVVEKEWLMERHNSITSLANGLFLYSGRFYKMEK